MDGTVIDVRVFTRDGVEKDARALSIEKSELESVRKDLDDTLRILEEDIYQRVERMLTGKMAQGGPNKLKSGSKITKAYLDEVPREQWFEIRLKNDEANEQLEKAPNASRRSAKSSIAASKRRKRKSLQVTTWHRACSRWSRSTWPLSAAFSLVTRWPVVTVTRV